MTTAQKIRVAIAGAAGKMGREAVSALTADERFEVVAVLTRQTGQAQPNVGIPAYTDSEELLVEVRPDIWVDFTDATSVVAHVDRCLAHGVRPVIGATGYRDEDLTRWNELAEQAGIGAIAAPNFALGALLMIRFAKEAARFFPDVEIIELHHQGKKDAPSGTAKRTAVAIAEEWSAAASFSAASSSAASTSATSTLANSISATSVSQASSATQQQAATKVSTTTADADRQQLQQDLGVLPARGLELDNIHIHSVRLPGLVAHQEVIFGGSGETLTIRHDSLARSSFMQGLIVACERVMDLSGLVYGLENLLW